MPRPDATASAALDNNIFPIHFCFLDIVGDPTRANTSGMQQVISGSGKPDLDGTYLGVPSKLASVSPVKVTDRGTDTVTARLSGIIAIDSASMTILGNRANWKGRKARLWRLIRDSNRTQQGGIQHYYTGYMVNLTHGGDGSHQFMEITIENYIAALAAPAFATLQDQADFDPGDLSPRASVALANGVGGNPLTANTPVVVGGGVGDGGRGLVGRIIADQLK